MQQVLDNLKDLPSGTGAKDIDLIFLKGIMESPIVRSLAKVSHKLSHTTIALYSTYTPTPTPSSNLIS